MVEMRLAAVEDAQAISRIMATGWKNTYRGILNDGLLDSIKDDRWVQFLTHGMATKRFLPMVMLEDEQIIGTAIARATTKQGEVKTSAFYLLPDKIGKGYGHRFIVWIENKLSELGFTHWVFSVFENNKRAVKFFIAHGFINTGRIIEEKYGEDYIRNLIFEKNLTELL